MAQGAEGEDALLRPHPFLVAPGPADRRIEAVAIKRLLEAVGLPHLGVERRAVVERIDAALLGLRVAVDDQLHSGLGGGAVAKLVHRPELPHRVDVKEREGRLRRGEGQPGELEQHRAVLAGRIEHNRPLALGRSLTQYVDRLGLEPLEMGERHCLAS
jgi:hypothetical protein